MKRIRYVVENADQIAALLRRMGKAKRDAGDRLRAHARRRRRELLDARREQARRRR